MAVLGPLNTTPLNNDGMVLMVIIWKDYKWQVTFFIILRVAGRKRYFWQNFPRRSIIPVEGAFIYGARTGGRGGGVKTDHRPFGWERGCPIPMAAQTITIYGIEDFKHYDQK